MDWEMIADSIITTTDLHQYVVTYLLLFKPFHPVHLWS